jgi:HAD superfamily hydrolase (TIGR01549 family)
MKSGTQSERLNGPISEAEERERVDYYHRARDEMVYRTKLFPHTIDVLASLKTSGRFKIGLVTSTERRTTVSLLERFGLSGFFDTVVCGEDAEPKPSPEPIILACKRLGVEVADALYVGDTDADIIAGKSAGCDTAIVATSRTAEELAAIGGILPIKDLCAVLPLVGMGRAHG